MSKILLNTVRVGTTIALAGEETSDPGRINDVQLAGGVYADATPGLRGAAALALQLRGGAPTVADPFLGVAATAALGAPQPWSPLQLPGLGLWYSAASPADLELSGTNVILARDKSGNRRSAKYSTGTYPVRDPARWPNSIYDAVPALTFTAASSTNLQLKDSNLGLLAPVSADGKTCDFTSWVLAVSVSSTSGIVSCTGGGFDYQGTNGGDCILAANNNALNGGDGAVIRPPGANYANQIIPFPVGYWMLGVLTSCGGAWSYRVNGVAKYTWAPVGGAKPALFKNVVIGSRYTTQLVNFYESHFAELGMVCSRLTPQQLAVLEMYLLTKMGMWSAFMAEGDSITAGQGGTAYTTTLATNALQPTSNAAISATCLAYPGGAAATMMARAAANVDPYLVGPLPILGIWGGTNDLYFGMTANDLKAAIVAYAAARRAATPGVRILWPTYMPRQNTGTPADFEVKRQDVNAWMRGNRSLFCDRLVDIGADSSPMGYAGACLDTNYFDADKVHPSPTGHAFIEQQMRAAARDVISGMAP